MHQIKYEFNNEYVTLNYNNQYICYHSFNVKTNFKRFTKKLQRDNPQSIIEVVSLANRYKISGQAGRKIV